GGLGAVGEELPVLAAVGAAEDLDLLGRVVADVPCGARGEHVAPVQAGDGAGDFEERGRFEVPSGRVGDDLGDPVPVQSAVGAAVDREGGGAAVASLGEG